VSQGCRRLNNPDVKEEKDKVKGKSRDQGFPTTNERQPADHYREK